MRSSQRISLRIFLLLLLLVVSLATTPVAYAIPAFPPTPTPTPIGPTPTFTPVVAVCNPPCSSGQICISAVDLYNQTGGVGIPGILLTAAGAVLPNICTLPTPTPIHCTSDVECIPFVCNAGICDTTRTKPTNTPIPNGEICPGKICDTAIGKIPTTPAEFSAKLLAILLSLSGGITLLIIIVSGYRIMTSQGNPEKLQGARETLTSAIVGLLFIIFSFVLLQIIAKDILRIPGFG